MLTLQGWWPDWLLKKSQCWIASCFSRTQLSLTCPRTSRLRRTTAKNKPWWRTRRGWRRRLLFDPKNSSISRSTFFSRKKYSEILLACNMHKRLGLRGEGIFLGASINLVGPGQHGNEWCWTTWTCCYHGSSPPFDPCFGVNKICPSPFSCQYRKNFSSSRSRECICLYRERFSSRSTLYVFLTCSCLSQNTKLSQTVLTLSLLLECILATQLTITTARRSCPI